MNISMSICLSVSVSLSILPEQRSAVCGGCLEQAAHVPHAFDVNGGDHWRPCEKTKKGTRYNEQREPHPIMVTAHEMMIMNHPTPGGLGLTRLEKTSDRFPV